MRAATRSYVLLYNKIKFTDLNKCARVYARGVVTQCTRITDTLEGTERNSLVSSFLSVVYARLRRNPCMYTYTWVVALLIAYTTGLVQIKFPSSTTFYPRACCTSRLDKRIVTLRTTLLATRYRRGYRLSFCSFNSTSIEQGFAGELLILPGEILTNRNEKIVS